MFIEKSDGNRSCRRSACPVSILLASFAFTSKRGPNYQSKQSKVSARGRQRTFNNQSEKGKTGSVKSKAKQEKQVAREKQAKLVCSRKEARMKNLGGVNQIPDV